MIRVVLLGAGNVAQHLYTALNNQSLVTIVQCYNRKGQKLHDNQNEETIIQNLHELTIADIYILAISDDAIAEVSSNLPFYNRLVVHTSGSAPMSTLNNKNNRGVFYPLQTFSKDKTVDFSTIPFCLETEKEKDFELLKKIGSSLTEKLYKISSEQRNALHVAAVIVNNFTNYLFSLGNDICTENDIPFEILYPLMKETTAKITAMNPNDAQTGPAVRNDLKTIERHLDFLSDTTQKDIYQTLTKAIQSKYGKKL